MKVFVSSMRIDFGDCDPAGIVFYPNFFRWFDRATHDMFRQAGYTFAQIRADHGWLAWPLADVGARFRLPARAGEQIEIRTGISEWHERTFRLSHQVFRNDQLLVDGWELRFMGETHPDDPARLRAVVIPASMKEAFA